MFPPKIVRTLHLRSEDAEGELYLLRHCCGCRELSVILHRGLFCLFSFFTVPPLALIHHWCLSDVSEVFSAWVSFMNAFKRTWCNFKFISFFNGKTVYCILLYHVFMSRTVGVFLSVHPLLKIIFLRTQPMRPGFSPHSSRIHRR